MNCPRCNQPLNFGDVATNEVLLDEYNDGTERWIAAYPESTTIVHETCLTDEERAQAEAVVAAFTNHLQLFTPLEQSPDFIPDDDPETLYSIIKAERNADGRHPIG